MKADNIVVLQKGKVVQQGTHDQLMSEVGGDYWNLANAQQLSLSDGPVSGRRISDPEKRSFLEEDVELPSEDFEVVPCSEFSIKERKPYLGNFMLFLWEQNYQWKWYCVMIIGALGAGCKFASLSTLSSKY